MQRARVEADENALLKGLARVAIRDNACCPPRGDAVTTSRGAPHLTVATTPFADSNTILRARRHQSRSTAAMNVGTAALPRPKSGGFLPGAANAF